jgi:hypothetical protein
MKAVVQVGLIARAPDIVVRKLTSHETEVGATVARNSTKWESKLTTNNVSLFKSSISTMKDDLCDHG